MTENNNICQVKMYRDVICSRQVYEDDKCICHADREDKDIKLFQEELDKIFADEETVRFDLTRFIFPKSGYKIPEEYKKNVHFTRALFKGEVNFNFVKFYAKSIFNNVQFYRNVNFYNSQFSDLANFNNAQFYRNVVFNNVQFIGDANFGENQFSGNAGFGYVTFLGKAYFRNTSFLMIADFKSSVFSSDASFEHVIFSGASKFFSTQFSGEANFLSAQFFGEVNFFTTRFFGEACFSFAQFLGVAGFLSVQFTGVASFRFALFSGEASFNSAQFTGDADFSNITISKEMFFKFSMFNKKSNFSSIALEKEAILMFDAEFDNKKMFEKDTDLHSISMQNNALITFRKIKLDKCSFLETDLTKVQFVDVEWAKKDSRKCVYDEKKILDNKGEPQHKYDILPYKLIAQEYRRLQNNYIDNFNYAEAGDFYIGEQEMMRLEKGKYGQYFCWNYLYKIISSYGESYSRPLKFLTAFLFVIPLILLFTGVNLPADSSTLKDGVTKISYEMVNYDWSFNPLDIFLFKTDYWKTVYGNTTILMFSKSNVDIYLITWWQKLGIVVEMLMVYILLAFFLLALRRPYRRKSF